MTPTNPTNPTNPTVPRDRLLLTTLGAMSIWPMVYIGLFFAFVFGTMGAGITDFFPAVMAVHAMTAVLGMILVLGYAIHALTDRRLPTQERLLWAILLFVGNILALPAYWYLRLWKQDGAVGEGPAET